MAQSSCVLTIFSSLCLNGNSAVGIVSSTSILDIKTAMTKKKMVLQNSEDFFCNFLQFGVPLNGLRTWIFLLLKIMCLFFLALKSTTATIGNLDIIVPQVSAWDQKLGTCVQNLPLRLTSFQISILHKITTLKQTRWCSRVYMWTLGCFTSAFQHQGKP